MHIAIPFREDENSPDTEPKLGVRVDGKKENERPMTTLENKHVGGISSPLACLDFEH